MADGEILTFTIPPEGIDRLDTWLTSCCEGFSRARVQGLMKSGLVTVDGVVCTKSNITIKPGAVVNVEIPPPVPAEPEPEDIPLSILFEDDDLLALDKPAGLVVHPAPGHLSGTLVNALLHHCPSLTGIGGVARPGIVHRLDQDTSGVMVVAKSQRAMDVLTKEFATHANMSKTYLAIIHGKPNPPQGRIETLIGRSQFDRKKMAVVNRNGKNAITNYKLVPGGIEPLNILECEIETGRTHQIRVHASSVLGCPIAGDEVYGHLGWDKKLPTLPSRQLLHAWKLGLKHPVTRKPMVFESPVPEDFKPFIKQDSPIWRKDSE